jgi:hypothetical protein
VDGCGTDGGWGVATIDAARAALDEVEARLAGLRGRAADLVDDTAWHSDAVRLYRARAAAWLDAIAAVEREVGQVRADLLATRRDILLRAGSGCG